MNRQQLREMERKIEEKYKNQKLEATIPNIKYIKRLRSSALLNFKIAKTPETVYRNYNKLMHIETFFKVRRYYLENVRKKEIC